MRFSVFNRKFTACLAMAFACSMVAACAQMKDEPYGSARIVSEPPGAKVVNLKDNLAIGVTPMEYTWKTDDGKAEYIQLVLTSEGYANTVTSFWISPRYASEKDATEHPEIITVPMEKSR